LEALLTSTLLVVVAEIGNKTQFATVALAARFDALAAVVVGTTLGMLIADVPAVWIGEKLAQKIPMQVVRILAAAVFVVVGALTLWGALRTAG
jgi:putative Ca2+/H+ antiporter (TMEM165/GDT1 family)